jgi:hypothetical protein
MELYSAVCTSTLSPRFYTPGDDGTRRIRELVERCNKDFVAKLAIYAREQMYLRSVPLVLLVELARNKALKAETVVRVVQRVDEITELLGYYQLANGRTETKKLNKLSKAIERGIKELFNSGKFDEYQFAKYDRKTEISLKDAVFLTHPSAKRQPVIQKIVDGTLEVPFTWETELSAKGNKPKVWENLIDSRRVGYMALMRNLRNILTASTEEGDKVGNSFVQQVCNYLSNPEAVAKSRQLPFRYLSAYQQLKQVESPMVPTVLEALEKAVLHTAANIQGYDENTTVLIACDVSGSMEEPINKRSTVERYDIGLMLGMLLQSRCKSVITGMFGDRWKVIQVPRTQILSNVAEFHRREGEVGYSTNGWKVLEWCINQEHKIDKIMMFTDCQMWNTYEGSFGSDRSRNTSISSLWRKYKEINPDAKLYLFDMAGYGTTPLSIQSNDVHLISGWSDKIFSVLAAIEQGQNAIDIIRDIE